MKAVHHQIGYLLPLLLAACSSVPPAPPVRGQGWPGLPPAATNQDYFRLDSPDHANEIVLYAMGLLDVGYRFGGRNPEAGLDCSGMVSYVVEQVSGRKLPHSAAQIAELTRPVTRTQLQPADLVFFNTDGRPFSHMGIYLGGGRFVHAPSTNGSVRVEKLDGPYFSRRFTAARSLF